MMLSTWDSNNGVKYLHERYLGLMYNDKTTSNEEVLEKDGSVSIHHKIIGILGVGVFKIKTSVSPAIVSDTFLA